MAPAHTPVSPLPKIIPLPILPIELQDLLDSVTRRLLDLENYQVPQLNQCKGPLNLHEQYVSNIRIEMVGIKRDLEELKLLVDDLDRVKDRRAGESQILLINTRLNSITKLYREAVVNSKRVIDNSIHSNSRDELFQNASKSSSIGGSNGRTVTEIAVSPDDALMNATSDVTEGLRRTMQLMQQELDRSLISNEILESSTATMQMTSDQYSTFSSLLSTSKALITSLERADYLDRLILLFALIFFFLCCAYVFKRRVVDKGVRVAGALSRVISGKSQPDYGSASGELRRSFQEEAEELFEDALLATASLAAAAGAATHRRRGRMREIKVEPAVGRKVAQPVVLPVEEVELELEDVVEVPQDKLPDLVVTERSNPDEIVLIVEGKIGFPIRDNLPIESIVPSPPISEVNDPVVEPIVEVAEPIVEVVEPIVEVVEPVIVEVVEPIAEVPLPPTIEEVPTPPIVETTTLPIVEEPIPSLELPIEPLIPIILKDVPVVMERVVEVPEEIVEEVGVIADTVPRAEEVEVFEDFTKSPPKSNMSAHELEVMMALLRNNPPPPPPSPSPSSSAPVSISTTLEVVSAPQPTVSSIPEYIIPVTTDELEETPEILLEVTPSSTQQVILPSISIPVISSSTELYNLSQPSAVKEIPILPISSISLEESTLESIITPTISSTPEVEATQLPHSIAASIYYESLQAGISSSSSNAAAESSTEEVIPPPLYVTSTLTATVTLDSAGIETTLEPLPPVVDYTHRYAHHYRARGRPQQPSPDDLFPPSPPDDSFSTPPPQASPAVPPIQEEAHVTAVPAHSIVDETIVNVQEDIDQLREEVLTVEPVGNTELEEGSTILSVEHVTASSYPEEPPPYVTIAVPVNSIIPPPIMEQTLPIASIAEPVHVASTVLHSSDSSLPSDASPIFSVTDKVLPLESLVIEPEPVSIIEPPQASTIHSPYVDPSASDSPIVSSLPDTIPEMNDKSIPASILPSEEIISNTPQDSNTSPEYIPVPIPVETSLPVQSETRVEVIPIEELLHAVQVNRPLHHIGRDSDLDLEDESTLPSPDNLFPGVAEVEHPRVDSLAVEELPVVVEALVESEVEISSESEAVKEVAEETEVVESVPSESILELNIMPILSPVATETEQVIDLPSPFPVHPIEPISELNIQIINHNLPPPNQHPFDLHPSQLIHQNPSYAPPSPPLAEPAKVDPILSPEPTLYQSEVSQAIDPLPTTISLPVDNDSPNVFSQETFLPLVDDFDPTFISTPFESESIISSITLDLFPPTPTQVIESELEQGDRNIWNGEEIKTLPAVTEEVHSMWIASEEQARFLNQFNPVDHGALVNEAATIVEEEAVVVDKVLLNAGVIPTPFIPVEFNPIEAISTEAISTLISVTDSPPKVEHITPEESIVGESIPVELAVSVEIPIQEEELVEEVIQNEQIVEPTSIRSVIPTELPLPLRGIVVPSLLEVSHFEEIPSLVEVESPLTSEELPVVPEHIAQLVDDFKTAEDEEIDTLKQMQENQELLFGNQEALRRAAGIFRDEL